MIGLFCFVLAFLASPFKSKLRLEAENAVLRHPLNVLRRRLRGRAGSPPGPLVLGPAVSLVSRNLAGSHDHPARDARALASGQLSLLLALEVAPIGTATADRHKAARIDPSDEHRQSVSMLYGFVILRLDRRELVWINVTTRPTAEWVARQITEAFPWDGAPGYMV
jgi:hypothetical protein